MNKLENVVAKVNPTGKSDTRYVVQKYIGKLSDYNKLNKNWRSLSLSRISRTFVSVGSNREFTSLLC